MKKGGRAQVALEFLSTYAWAILVILITIGALYYFGIFNLGDFVPQTCVFPAQFECADFAMIDNVIRFKLLNNVGEDITIDSLSIRDDTGAFSCTPPAAGGTWTKSTHMDFEFTNCAGGAYLVGERSEVFATIVYYSPRTSTQPRHNINGKISGTVVEQT